MLKMGVLKVEIVLLLNLLVVSGDVYNNEVSEHSLELTQSLNLARQELIQETCRHFPPKYGLDELPPSQLEHILINEEHKLLYCYVPKVACTNWKRIFMMLSGKWNGTDVLSITASIAHTPGLFRDLSNVSKAERDYMLENYNKMIIVRNPFERLLSAFRNKLEGDTLSARYFQDRIGRRIIKAYRENPSNESLEYGRDVTFKEFALFLTNRSEEMADVVNNEHWQPITNLCHPCLIKYTLVGKYETLLDDSTLALHTINASHIQFPRLDHTSGTAEKLHRYFSQLDLPLIRRLYKLYKHDYRIFNYNLDNIVGFDLG
ncbi:carbohydrate sulfotransferase 11 [Spodoptera litura]|uniref:Carbohydrate sulfotransferase n=1 Tax=Spodoptera litura TaxID=69820 RepID=A0A9J7IMR2_SPOLT|nr:carbohydrate sulfotransferase 11 [Spodoptera litura]